MGRKLAKQAIPGAKQCVLRTIWTSPSGFCTGKTGSKRSIFNLSTSDDMPVSTERLCDSESNRRKGHLGRFWKPLTQILSVPQTQLALALLGLSAQMALAFPDTVTAGLRVGGPGTPPFWRTGTRDVFCTMELGSVTLKINNQHTTHTRF